MDLSEFNKNKEELTKLNQSFAALNDGFKNLISERKQAKADMGGEKDDDKMGEMMDYMHSLFSNVHSRIYAMEDNFYSYAAQHDKGHIPPLSPSQMNKMLKGCDANEDYVAQPKVIYASKGKNYLEVEMKRPN